MNEIDELKQAVYWFEKKLKDYDWLAEQFVSLDSGQQASFFMAVSEKFADMRGGVACTQNHAIAHDMVKEARDYVRNLAEHVESWWGKYDR